LTVVEFLLAGVAGVSGDIVKNRSPTIFGKIPA